MLAVFLGASSLEDAIDGVDNLHRAADATSGVLDEARAARVRVARCCGGRHRGARSFGRSLAQPLRAPLSSQAREPIG